MKKEFIAVFQLSKMRVFEVEYYTLLSNSSPHFTTSANEFISGKSDWGRCGQAQDYVLKGYPTAMAFYKKWDPMHLSDLTEEQYAEMRSDLEALCQRYNYMLRELDESKRPYNPRFHFSDLREWTKQTPKSRLKSV